MSARVVAGDTRSTPPLLAHTAAAREGADARRMEAGEPAEVLPHEAACWASPRVTQEVDGKRSRARGCWARLRDWRRNHLLLPKVIDAAQSANAEYLESTLTKEPRLALRFEWFTRRSALAAAARKGDATCVSLVLNAMANAPHAKGVLSQPGVGGRTPLHLACCRKYSKDAEDVVRILLRAGANPTARDADRYWTPLHYACAANRPDAVEALLEYHTLDCINNKFEQTPLMIACRVGCAASVGILLSNSAGDWSNRSGPSRIMGGGSTALHFAAMSGATDSAWRLITEKPDIQMVSNFNGWTAIDVARKYRRSHLEALLSALWIPDDPAHEALWVFLSCIVSLLDHADALANGDATMVMPLVNGPSHTAASAVTCSTAVADEKADMCSICTTRPITLGFKSCKHTACLDCTKNVVRGQCPSLSALLNPECMRQHVECPFCRSQVDDFYRLDRP